jgi:deoxycytidylate deaminase
MHLAKAEALIQRDQEEIGIGHGQNVRGIFHKADVFLDTTEVAQLTDSIERFVQLLFGNTFHTPTRQEYGMFHALAAALRSAEPGRQVGAAIATDEGDIIAVGVNDVPKAGGGLYWCDDPSDGREFVEGLRSGEQYIESNQKHIRNLVVDTIKHLKKANWFEKEKSEMTADQLADLALKGNSPALPKGAQMRTLIEFGRAVHAEMDALSYAARRGVSVAGCKMYVTTFPCHLCARHIVAAGIREVIFIEPYAKSLTADLYPDSISIEQPCCNDKVQFRPFVGVAPRKYMQLFTMTKRKSDDGRILAFNPSSSRPRYFGTPRVYLDNEDERATILKNVLVKIGMKE